MQRREGANLVDTVVQKADTFTALAASETTPRQQSCIRTVMEVMTSKAKH
jgi:hypothetical protein